MRHMKKSYGAAGLHEFYFRHFGNARPLPAIYNDGTYISFVFLTTLNIKNEVFNHHYILVVNSDFL
jgi:hypothetical protein